jgi:DNA excision repair protein ERCC-1
MSNALLVNPNQQGNPVLKYVRNVHWQFASDASGTSLSSPMAPDYLLGSSTVAIFISLRYHLLKPDYIHTRLKNCKTWIRSGGSDLRVKSRLVVVQVDTEDSQVPLAQITKAAIHNDFTLFCGFTAAECGRYLETFKSYENKPAESIQKDLGADYTGRATSLLTSVRGVNKTDVKTLLSDGKCLADVLQAELKDLQSVAGIGPTKARRMHDAFHGSFSGWSE